ncbi:Na+-driven multidrug efflux pump [Pseudobutyrivibrio sp. NOR37]|uniref:Oligosaccharide flippase family protein n=1 Tax=Pseudobutyrivibrio xylanivorans TaxID=185007 RepID=A0A6M0LK28_PSEXY|nr:MULTISPECIES: MATE family efflux transporter [Pseudobutyrivibrio]NEX02309.1 oligosaccharide flippase family protein [Pseudobutyrivibrio xylanivorans]SFR77994.1 Na+-driven multidrug efflux pump [Pseudobutyrivibrio sp. NOR37]
MKKAELGKYIADKKTLISMVANMFIKGAGFLLSYLYIPLLLSYLEDEKYGLWATVLSIGTWITLCDVGIGGGLRNILTAEISKKQYEKAKESVSTAFCVLSILSFCLWLVLVFVTISYGWSRLFGTRISLNVAMFISYSFICINLILSLVNVILYSLQISEQVGLVNLLGGIINLIGIMYISSFSHANIIYVAIVYGLSITVPTIVNNYWVFRKYSYLKPSLKFFNNGKTKELLSLGVIFFVLQIAGLMLMATDNIIITRLFGSAKVTPIEIANKLFSIIKAFFAALVIPVWSRTTMAFTERDFAWIKKMYSQLILFLVVFGVGVIVLCTIVHPICKIWLGKDIEFGNGVLTIIAFGTFAEMVNTAFYSLLNGLGRIKIQLLVSVIQIVLNIPLSIYLATSCGMGVLGVKLSTTLLFVFGCFVYIIYTNISIKSLE